MSKIQVYCAVSIDGYMAGPNDDLSWLGQMDANRQADSETIDFPAFMKQTGAMLMGRRTFDVVKGFGGEWPYGSTPVLIATSRPIADGPETASTCSGDIRQLCEKARQAAGVRNVYLDGGQIISQALDADCIDEMILTVVPVLLGQGVRLYQGSQLQRFNAAYLGRIGKMLQIKFTKSPAATR